MFEKEAEEYALENYENCLYDDFPYVNDSRAREQSFKDGAEFGYNKAFVEADKNLKSVIADFNKVNEWHYVKDGDLPKDDIKLAIIEIDDCGYLLCNYRNGFWYDANSGATCAEWITNNIIAWKEIVPPKENE